MVNYSKCVRAEIISSTFLLKDMFDILFNSDKFLVAGLEVLTEVLLKFLVFRKVKPWQVVNIS